MPCRMISSPYDISPRFRGSPLRSVSNNCLGSGFQSFGKSARRLPKSLRDFDGKCPLRRDWLHDRKDSGSEALPTQEDYTTGSSRRSSGYKPSTVWLGSGNPERSSWTSNQKTCGFHRNSLDKVRLRGFGERGQVSWVLNLNIEHFRRRSPDGSKR